ncbi:MAG: hypothetical protein SF029_20010 [bacterium]|nr:hypothetical protein [bacterium]
MSGNPVNTSWMWKDGEELNGLKLNRDTGRLEWYDGVGCACGDSTAEQTVEQFRSRGPAFGNPPADVLEELETAITTLGLSN